MSLFKRKGEVDGIGDAGYTPGVAVGDIVTVSASNGYEKRFVIVEKGSLSIGHGGNRYRTDSDHRLKLVRLNEWTLGDPVQLEQQVGYEATGDGAADDSEERKAPFAESD